jgi:membrane-bound lytic murein transglycosylase F
MRRQNHFFFGFLLLLILQACSIMHDEDNKLTSAIIDDHSLNTILKRGTLIASTDNNSTDYFIYQNEPKGYQYELLVEYSKYLGVDLEVVVNNNLDGAFADLESGKVDVIAMGLAVTGERTEKFDFTLPMNQTRQMLVQRKPDNWRKMENENEMDKHLIRNPLDLGGKMVIVPVKSSYASRLRNLQQEIGDSIYIIEFPYDSEKLIEMVALGEIEYTVCDEHIARVNKKYYPDIDIETPVSFTQNLSWAVKKHADSLRNNLNEWLSGFKGTPVAQSIYNKYFVNPRSVQVANKFKKAKKGRISPWDDYLKEKSLLLDWDWRLIAALIYQESKFQPNASSWIGALGLMQLMPNTAELYGVDSTSSPEENILAGIKHLKSLDDRFRDIIKDPDERLKFVLAAYNSGIAHVFDARRLATKYKRNPNVWSDHVDYFLLNKSDPQYYNDSVVFFGYCRGEVPYRFVNEILDRYEHYRETVIE